MKRNLICLYVFLLFLFGTSSVCSAALFDLSVDSGGAPAVRQFTSVSDMFQGLTGANLQGLLPSYTSTSPLNAKLNFRGLPMTVTASSGNSSMRLQIPDIGVDLVFSGATRDASQTQLEDWFKKNGGEALSKLMKKLAEKTPFDPIAGNPNSAMSQTVSSDFSRGFFDSATSLITPAPTPTAGVQETNANVATLAARFSSLSQAGHNSSVTSLPLAYAFRFSDPQQKLTFNLPLTYADIDGSKSYGVGLGIGFTQPITSNWVLTPAVSYNGTGSADMASVGQIISGSLTSSVVFPVGPCKISMGNMVGYYRTLALKIGDYSFDPKIENYVFRNGLMLFIPTGNLIKNTGLELFGVDTRFTGDALYVKGYNEVGFSFGRTVIEQVVNKDNGMIKNFFNDLRIGASYTIAKDSNGFSANLGYSF